MLTLVTALYLLSAVSAEVLFNCTMDSIILCGLTQGQTDEFDWSRHAGTTSSANTGPTMDHTGAAGLGTYIYIESSFPRQQGDRAELYSNFYTITGHACLSFWYNMYGLNMGYLSVWTQDTAANHLIYVLSGNLGTTWVQASLNIPDNSLPYRFIFQGVVGTDFTGDIALDDIMFTTPGCNGNGPTRAPAISRFHCDFEDPNRCGFTEEHDDVFDWTYHNGPSPSINTGPQYDHTHQDHSGHYLYLETSSPRLPNQAARTDSPLLTTGRSRACLQFFYSMKGATMGTLNVYIKVNGVLGQPIFTKSGAQSLDGQWQFAQHSLDDMMPGFNVVFEGIVGSSFTGDIAIDDITIKDSDCF